MGAFFKSKKVWALTCVTVSFLIVGWVIGFFVGESRVPVMGTLIPLIIGLLSVVSLGFFDRQATLEKVFNGIKEAQEERAIDIGTLAELKRRLGTEPNYFTAVFWLFWVGAFTTGCYFGLQKGIHFRVPQYPAVSELVQGTKPTPYEISLLNELCWHLQSNHRSEEEVHELFQTSIKPILAEKDFEPTYGNNCRLCRLLWVVDRIKEVKRSDSAVPCSYHGPEPPPDKGQQPSK